MHHNTKDKTGAGAGLCNDATVQCRRRALHFVGIHHDHTIVCCHVAIDVWTYCMQEIAGTGLCTSLLFCAAATSADNVTFKDKLGNR